MSDKKPTLAGRILRGVGFGIIDGLPIVAQVVNVVRQHKAEQAEPEPVKEEPVTRTITGWITLGGVVLGLASNLASGTLDCEALRSVLVFFGVNV
jgi:hypothetical protein